MKELHYPGDCRPIVGQVVGPTTLGQLLTIIAADYDETSDVTTAHLRAATQGEVDAHLATVTVPAAFGGGA